MYKSHFSDRWRWLAALVIALGLLGFAPGARASDGTYSFDDSLVAGGPYAGTGVFTLTVGAPLGEYPATGVAGSGDAFGTWRSVQFRATPGGFTSLVISNLVDASIEFSLPGIGGGEIDPGSQADLEWAHFLTEANRIGLRIAPLSTVVPESSTWLGAAGICGAAAVVGIRRRGQRRGGKPVNVESPLPPLGQGPGEDRGHGPRTP